MTGHELTGREVQAIDLVAKGESNKMIALTLEIGANRVKTIVHQVCVKLEAENRTEAAAKWIAMRGGETASEENGP